MSVTPDPLAALPPLLQPQHKHCYIEATGEVERAWCAAWVAQRALAIDSAMVFAKKHGATKVMNPWAHSDAERPGWFGFPERPAGKHWTVARPRARDEYFRATPNRKTELGAAILAEMEALEPFPPGNTFAKIANLITDISYADEDGAYGSGGLGFIDVGQLAFVDGRYFVHFPNPFRPIKEHLDEPGRTITHPENAVDWRPGPGWALISEANVELVFAQAKVAEERAAA